VQRGGKQRSGVLGENIVARSRGTPLPHTNNTLSELLLPMRSEGRTQSRAKTGLHEIGTGRREQLAVPQYASHLFEQTCLWCVVLRVVVLKKSALEKLILYLFLKSSITSVSKAVGLDY
jgi:hypothetical protein